MTPHINAKQGEIADFVLMPGDPLRAKVMANRYLKDVQLVSDVRNVLMFTGTYLGRKISICASGMGSPSIGIYAYELFKFYDVKTIIRVGSAGSYQKNLKLYDIVLASSAYSENNQFTRILGDEARNVTKPDTHLVNQIIKISKDQNIPIRVGRVHTNDVFYNSRPLEQILKETGNPLAVEMESFSLFAIAKVLNKSAASLLTISDNLITHEVTTAEERQNSFDKMILLALEASV